MEKEGRTRLDFCKKCKKCCHARDGVGEFILSKHDIKRMQKAGKRIEYVKHGNVFRLKLEKGKCKFLGLRGCELPEKIRPLDCKLFPVYFYPTGNRIDFMVSLKCPFWNKISDEYIEIVKKEALNDLKHWTKKEQIGYWL